MTSIQRVLSDAQQEELGAGCRKLPHGFEESLVAIVMGEVATYRAVIADFGGAVALDLVHLVEAAPGEEDAVGALAGC